MRRTTRPVITPAAYRTPLDVQRENLRTIIAAGLRKLRPAEQQPGTRARRPVVPLDLDERIGRYQTPGCKRCSGHRGLVKLGRCNCDPSPDGIHHALCGFEPCPNGCYDRRRRTGQPLTGRQYRRAAHKAKLPSQVIITDAKDPADVGTPIRLTAAGRVELAYGGGRVA